MAEISFQTVKQWTIARFEGSVLTDSQLIERAREEISRRISILPLRCRVLINFKGVEFVSSQVIGLLLDANRRIEEKSGTLKLCHVTPKIREALHITGLIDKFDIARREVDVVGKLQRKTAAVSADDVGWLD
jgi:anti-anti-sigma factor